MVRSLPASLLLLFSLPSLVFAAELTLTSPIEYQVTQRQTRTEGHLRVQGNVDGAEIVGIDIEARVTKDAKPGSWQKLTARFDGPAFDAAMTLPAGGWYQFEVRASKSGTILAETKVDHVGIGEVFVVAGQSNSANHGETKQTTQTGRVASVDGQHWQLANDPQRGASGNGGSFMPPLGDELVKRFDVPIGFVPCGIGATSVREWLPKGATFPNPPTIESRVEKLPSGEWASKGDAYARFLAKMQLMGPNGFRAVLWHQGESDAHQQDPTRTLPGKLYREYLERIILASRSEIGWDAPWFVAQVSYHVPGDEASPDIREAQASLAKDGIAFAGPDSDALKGDLRERNGQGVHFSDAGLKAHAAKWAEKLAPWLERELGNTTVPATPGRKGELSRSAKK